MRLKTKLVLAITGLVFVVVTVLSLLFLTELLRQQIAQSYMNTDFVAHQVQFATRHAIEGMRRPDTNDPEAVRAAVASTLRKDEALNSLISSVIRYAPTIFDISVAYADGRALISSDPLVGDKVLPCSPRLHCPAGWQFSPPAADGLRTSPGLQRQRCRWI